MRAAGAPAEAPAAAGAACAGAAKAAAAPVAAPPPAACAVAGRPSLGLEYRIQVPEAAKTWPKSVTGDKYAIPDEIGDTVNCNACITVGNNKRGESIKARHKFCGSNWRDHCNSVKHKENVAKIEAREEKAKEAGKPNKVCSKLFGYFNRVKSQKQLRKEQRAADDYLPPAPIDLIHDEPEIQPLT